MNSIAIIAALPSGAALQAAASAVVGIAAAAFAWWIVAVLRSEDLQQGDQWRYDVSRINELRRADWFFRLLQPAVQLLARPNRKLFRDGLPAVGREIQAAGLSRFWLPEEYLGKIELIALFCAPIYIYFFFGWFGGVGLLLSAVFVALTAWLLRRRLAARVAARRWR